MELNVPSWSELRVRHAAEMSRIDSEISSLQRETNRLRQQNELRRQQLERFDRAFVVLRRKLRAQTWQATTTARAYLALLEQEGLTSSLQ